jgi:uncharacterized membrane protein YbhN (UPF0104 family)
LSGRTSRRILLTAAGVGIAITTLWFLITPETVDAVRSAVSVASLPWLLAALAMMPLVQSVRALRFNTLLFGSGAIRPGLWAVTTSLLAVNTIVPFKLGEASFPVMVRRLYGLSLADGAGVILFARILDLASIAVLLLLIALLSGLTDAAGVPAWMVLVLLAGLAVISVSPFTMALRPVGMPGDISHPVQDDPKKGGTAARLMAELTQLRSRITTLRAAAIIVLTSYATWMLHALAALMAVTAVQTAFSAPVPPGTAAAAGLVSNVAFALPVAGVAGLGAPQAAWVALMHVGDVPFADAVVGAFAYTAVTLTATAILGAIGGGMLLSRMIKRESYSTAVPSGTRRHPERTPGKR